MLMHMNLKTTTHTSTMLNKLHKLTLGALGTYNRKSLQNLIKLQQQLRTIDFAWTR